MIDTDGKLVFDVHIWYTMSPWHTCAGDMLLLSLCLLLLDAVAVFDH